ncbi:hypothetical protein CKAH01_03851 [Colletotrichum kahawae]|uniref:DUF6546 domain-containing protein n=1 Tax=Colletotrichum kahawae TaxID=34407 RepID=A0AAD9YQK1_COLKA|nr:hypothetical protein CKAH01_03851 [Colletotrichum kahawae]
MAGSSTAATPWNHDWEKWSIGHKIFQEEELWQQILDSQDENFKHDNLRFLRLDVSFGNMAFISCLPKKVKNISVYEDNNESYAKRIVGVDRLLRVRNNLLGQAFAKASQKLKKLSVAFMVEAEDFFEECNDKRLFRWPHLEYLTLTSRLLAHNDHNAISEMLQKAANVAKRMRNLKTMAVWFGTEQKAYCFAYHQRSGKSCITWQGTELLADDPELIQSWANVAEIHGAIFHGFTQNGLSDIRWKLGSPCFADLTEELMLAHGLKSHGDAAFLFRDLLPEDVIDPLSLWQMQQEARVL